MKKTEWFQRSFEFGLPVGLLPFFLERLSGTASRMRSKVNGVSDEVLSLKLDGKWSIKENLAHLAEVDEIALRRIDEMVNGISPMSPAVIQPGRDYNSQPVNGIIEYFERNRAANLRRYSQLSEEELTRSSLHPRLKVQMSPIDLAFFDAEHDDHHLVRVNEILSQLLKK